MIQAPKSQYEQIAELLRDRIADQTYPPGSSLPSEPELSAELGVSRVTVNRAIVLLRAQGLVRVRRGAGTYVRSLPIIVRDARRRYARRDRGTGAGAVEVGELSLQPRTDYLEIGRTAASVDVARALGINDGDDVLVRRRVLYANDEPTQIADSYYPWHLVVGSALLQADTGRGGSYGRLADLGIDVVRFTEDVNVRVPSDHERTVLHLEGSQPVFDIVHKAWAAEKTPVAVTFHVMPGHLWTLRYDWDDHSDGSAPLP
jgi:GntR family transcriptional regulator